MSIPDRFYRIAKHKLGEMKDWFDKVDEEEDFDAERRQRAEPRPDARRELNDSLMPSNSTPSGVGRDTSTSIPMNPPRTPQEIQRGVRPTTASASNYSSGGTSGNMSSSGTTSSVPQVDPLDYHYKLLGLEPGANFASVQAAYSKLAARCDPARFPAGSQEEQSARQIRQRLEVSYKQLRETLDTTAARFGLLEF